MLASEINGARLVVVPNADHNVPVRAEQAFTRLLANFLDELNVSDWREAHRLAHLAGG